MPQRMTRAQRNDDTRRRLLESARKIFGKHGYYAATLDQVAEVAGFSKGAVYSQFDSKADLFLALYEERIEQRILQLQQTLARVTEESAASTAQRGVTQWFETARRDIDFQLLIIEFRVHVARNPELRQRYMEIYQRLRAAYATLIEASLVKQKLVASIAVPDMVRLELAIGPGLLLAQQLEPEAFPDTLIDQFQHAFLAGANAIADAPTSKKHKARA